MTRSDDGNINRHASSSPAKHKGNLATLTSTSTSATATTTMMTTVNSSISARARTRTIGPLLSNTVGMILTCLIGLALSGYATYVEIQVEKDDDYHAMCDISEKISCTKVFASRFGKGFGIVGWIFGEKSLLNTPNGELGIVFYILIGILSFFRSQFLTRIQLGLVMLSNVSSIYLAYLLYFVLHNLCLVCVGTYFVNFFLLILTWQRLKLFDVTTEHPYSAKLD